MNDAVQPGAPPREPFAAVLGAAFAQLPGTIRRLHRDGARRFAGRATVERGTNVLARLLATIAGLPPASTDGAIVVELDPLANGERWTRRFNGHVMRSRLWATRDGLLAERLGPVTFAFALEAHADALVWRVVRVRALGVPLPARWFAQVAAREAVDGAHYTFDVRAALPLVGTIVHYRGRLELD